MMKKYLTLLYLISSLFLLAHCKKEGQGKKVVEEPKREESSNSSGNSDAVNPAGKVEPKAPSCLWKDQEIKSGLWAEDQSGSSQYRYCLCDSGNFVQCGQSLPSNVKTDMVVKVGTLAAPGATNLSCTWKGKEIADGRWVEDAAATYRYCQCQNGKFASQTCGQTLPAGVSPESVVKIEPPAPASLSCTWKGKEIPDGRWVEDPAAVYRYCQCQSGKFAAGTCGQTLPAGVSPADVIKIP